MRRAAKPAVQPRPHQAPPIPRGRGVIQPATDGRCSRHGTASQPVRVQSGRHTAGTSWPQPPPVHHIGSRQRGRPDHSPYFALRPGACRPWRRYSRRRASMGRARSPRIRIARTSRPTPWWPRRGTRSRRTGACTSLGRW